MAPQASSKHRVLVFEVNTNFTRYALFTNGRMGIPATIATPRTGTDAFYDALAAVVRRQRVPLDGVAVSCPGWIEAKTQTARTAGALTFLSKQQVAREIVAHAGRPELPTWIENDANCAAMAEKQSGNAQKLDDFAMLTLDTGVGGALFLDGHLRRGRDGRASELGQMIINYDSAGPLPLHDFVSTLKLSEWYAQEFGGAPGEVLPSSLFHRLDEPRVRAIVEKWLHYLAVGIFNVVVTVDPEVVLIGGSISREPLLLPMLDDALDSLRDWHEFKTAVKRCKHSGNAGLMGAYYAFMEEVGV
ncbi:MAG: ROK family protein [Bifidobacterium sp.]|nr:ROK family protein [Bifidobacterium sp.]